MSGKTITPLIDREEIATPFLRGSSSEPLQLKPGPAWLSFEQFRIGGAAALSEIAPSQVGTLSSKTGVFRVVRDDDFQRLLGLATEVHRLRSGVRVVMRAARVVLKHNDRESIELLVESAASLADSCIPPERKGHAPFEITEEERAENNESLDQSAIPRPPR